MTLSAAPAHVWEFDSSLADAVGGWNLSGTVTYSAGKLNNALSQLKLATYASGVYAIGMGAWSISAWVKPTNSYSGDGLCFLQIGGMELYFTANNTTDDAIVVRDVATALIQASSDYALLFALNVWYQICITRTSGGVLKIYLNATLLKTTTLASISDGAGIVTAGDVNESYVSTDQTAIFDFALTAADVTYIYNAGAGRAYADWEIGSSAPSTTTYDRTILLRR